VNTVDFISLLCAYRAQMEALTNSGRLRRRRAAYRGAVRAARVLGAIEADEAAALYEAGEVVFRARWEEIAPPPRQPA
jgi:hypothetical protein